MFKWSNECLLEVNRSVQHIWEFCSNPSNWPKWMEKIESCHLDGELKESSIVKCKIKSKFPKDIYMSILVPELKPYTKSRTLIKAPLFTQETICIFEELLPQKTRIIMTICIKSVLVPFMKSFFVRKIEKAKSREFPLFVDAIEKG